MRSLSTLALIVFLSCGPEERRRQVFEAWNPTRQDLDSWCDTHWDSRYHSRFSHWDQNMIVCESETFPDSGQKIWKSRFPFVINTDQTQSLD